MESWDADHTETAATVRRDPWDDHAQWWQDEFTDGIDPEYTDQILPLIGSWMPACGVVVDVGAGEGQVSRVVCSPEVQVIATDPAWAQVSVGAERRSSEWWFQGSATALGLRAGSADAVIACLVFEHIREVQTALSEVARVLKVGGEFVFLLNHPLLQTPNSGWIDDQIIDPPEQYWRIGEYLTEAETVEQVQKDVFITFFHRPLSTYLNSAVDVGLSLVEMREPPPPDAFLAQAPGYHSAATIPRLLALRFVRRP